jgi:diacylglycerol kinase family enzyme
VRTVLTERRGHAAELAAAADGDAVVVYSGDGVFNEVLNGARDGVPLAFLPGGGTSVLPRALGLPRDAVPAARQVAEALLEGRTRTISLGRVNGRRFSFAAGVGLDAELVRMVDALGRREDGKRPGDLAYLAAAGRLLAGRRGRFEPALEVRGLGRAAFALLANTDPYSYVGRVPLHIAPEARFELGLDLVAPRRVTAATLPRLLRETFTGHGQVAADDVIYGHDLDRVEITCDRPLPLQADGEDLGDVELAVFEAERNAARVLV